MAFSTASISIFRLDVYRLASMVLSHTAIDKNDKLQVLNQSFFDIETYRLLETFA